MRVTKIFKIFLIVVLALINIIHSEVTFKEVIQFVEESLAEEGTFNTNPKMLAFFRIIPRKKKSERRKLDYMASVLKDFLSNLNIRSQVYNVENRHFLAIINQNDQISKELILSQFKDLISDVNILPPSAFRKKEENSNAKHDF